MSDAKEGLTVLAIDDEELALRDLVVMLQRSSEIESVLTAGSGDEALAVLAGNHAIDALFADLSMPGMSGIELGRALRDLGSELPVAFVTAHDEHAIEAYDLDVVDYVLKPVAPRRLAETIERLVRRVAMLASADPTMDETASPDPATTTSTTSTTDDVLVSRVGDRVVVINCDDVRLVEACGDYVRAHVGAGGAGHLVRTSISGLADRWEPLGFVRVHRGFLVRLCAISEIRPTPVGHVAVVDGREVPISRRYRPQLNEQLSRRGR